MIASSVKTASWEAAVQVALDPRSSGQLCAVDAQGPLHSWPLPYTVSRAFAQYCSQTLCTGLLGVFRGFSHLAVGVLRWDGRVHRGWFSCCREPQHRTEKVLARAGLQFKCNGGPSSDADKPCTLTSGDHGVRTE